MILRPTSVRRLRALALLPALALLAACGEDASSAEESGGPVVVASTNVYGDIAAAVAGETATVTSIITSATQDPHEYEATAQDRLALDGADLVIENGGGYDPFIDELLDGSASDAVRLTAVEIAGLLEDEDHSEDEGEADEGEADEDGHAHLEGANEHVWYDLHTAEELAAAIGDELSAIDPDNAAAYAANAATFVEGIEGLEERLEGLRSEVEGRLVVITEPVPVYLLAEAGLENLTPEEFSEAVEEGADVPPRALQQTLDLFADRDVSLLAYNSQAEDATTEQVRAAAEDAAVPVVEFSETLPEDQSYLEWFGSHLDELSRALS